MPTKIPKVFRAYEIEHDARRLAGDASRTGVSSVSDEKRLVSEREMARRIGCSVRTLQRWRADKRFREGIYHGPGGSQRFVRYDPAAILEALEADGDRRGRL